METTEMTIQSSMSTATLDVISIRVFCKRKTPSANNKKQTNGIPIYYCNNCNIKH